MNHTDKAAVTNGASPTLIAILCIGILGAAIYGNTLQVPWYFDDFGNIVRNPGIRDLNGAWHGLFAPRGLTMFSFALNYHFHGLELPGYHIINILIHLLTTFLVYLSLKRVFRCQPLLSLPAALIFLSHPLQTQSVTYIVQRMTCLSSLFFFLSLYFYIRAHEALMEGHRTSSPRHLLFYLASLASGVIAVYSKQNAAILPLCIFLFDRFFLPRQKRGFVWLTLYLLPYFAAPVWMALNQFISPVIAGKSLRTITATDDMAKGMAGIVTVKHDSGLSPPLSYLVTEFSVLWLYIRLLFLPYGQVLDYQYPLITSLLTLKNISAFFGLAGLLTFAATQYKRLPLVSFGILWFFIALSVESSFIPLDPVYEHRLYVPMFGFVVLVPQLLDPFCRNKTRIVILFSIVTVCAALTWKRNDLWSDETAFYKDQLAKRPNSTRAMVSLSKSYIDKGLDQEAEALLHSTILIDPGIETAYVNLSVILVRNKRMDEALQVLQRGVQSNPFSSELHNNIGVVYNLQGKPELAIPVLYKAISIAPDNASSYTNMGAAYAGLKRWTEAERYYRLAIGVSYDNPKAHFNLGVALFSMGRLPEAAEAFQLALKFAPRDADALFNLAQLHIERGNRQEAQALLPRLRSLNSELAIALENELAVGKTSLQN